MGLPDGIKAFFVLNAANLTDETERLTRATSQLSYKSMKDQIKKICGTAFNAKEGDSAPPVKEECLFGYEKQKRGSWRGRNWRGRGGGRSRGSGQERKRSEDVREGNPLDWRGNKIKCFICDSESHMIKDCPKKVSQESEEKAKEVVEEIQIVLLNASKPDSKQLTLVIDALGCALLDCGCTKTVAGVFWMKEYLEMLSAEDRKSVKEESSQSKFRFGDGHECKSMKALIIPIKVGRRKYLLRVEVVEEEIPLLLSKPSMKSLKMNLDFDKDVAYIGNEEIKLSCTSSGHYRLHLTPCNIDACNITLTVTEGLDIKQKKVKAFKLHRQFGHATEDKLMKLVKNSNVKDKELIKCIKEVCNTCETCQRYRSVPLKPVVSLPLSESFNEVVCLDLKELKKSWILHMIDSASRYSAARIIKSKDKDTVIKQIFQMWFAYFGRPGTLMSDNGSEFSNKVYTEASEKLGIEIKMPPAYSPFSNGVVERHNKILYETYMKTLEDTKCDPEVALAWACSAKNALANRNGYSPNQLVFGCNVNLPTVLEDKLPALTRTTSSEIVRKNLEAIHNARRNFIQAENSDRIRRALSHKTRTYGDQVYEAGDKVYFTLPTVKGWKGPARVLGNDGYTILVKQGGSIHKCHRSNVMKIRDAEHNVEGYSKSKKKLSLSSSKQVGKRQVKFKVPEKESRETNSKFKSSVNREAVKGDYSSSDSSSEDVEGDDDCEEEETDDDEYEEADDRAGESDSVEEEFGAEESIESNVEELGAEESYGGDEDGDTDSESQMEERDVESDSEIYEETGHADHENEGDGVVESSKKASDKKDECREKSKTVALNQSNFGCDIKPKANTRVSIKLINEDEWFEARVLSFQPKKNSVHKNWVNVEEVQGDAISVNWKDVEKWCIIPDDENVVLLSKVEELSQAVVDAKQRELQCLQTNQVFEEVDFKNQYLISTKWVFTEKLKEGAKVVKARLVARGFQENIDGIRTDSPTCSKYALRLVLITAACHHWEINSIDFASAFLQGNHIDREVFLRPPKDICPVHKVWKLKRCIYGLNDAPRAWYNKVSDELLRTNAVRSTIDQAMYMWYEGSKLIGHLVSHVDDFVFGGEGRWSDTVFGQLKDKFNISSEEKRSFKYVGLNVKQTNSAIFIDQIHYIESLSEIPLDRERKKNVHLQLTEEERSQLKSLSGQMLWVSTQTRPDMAFETCAMSVISIKMAYLPWYAIHRQYAASLQERRTLRTD